MRGFNIYTILLICISITTMVLVIRNILPREYSLSIKNYIVLEITTIIITTIIFYYSYEVSSMVVYIIPIYFLYLKNRRIIYSICTQGVACIIIIISSCLIEFIFKFILNGQAITDMNEKVFVSIIIMITAVLISIIYRRLYKIIKEKNRNIYNSKYIYFIYFILIITWILFYFTSNWVKSEEGFKNAIGSIFIVYILIVTIVVIFLLFIMKKEQNFKYKQIQLENLQSYTEKLEDLYMDMRKFKHDYVNILSSMSTFIEEDDIEGLKEFFYKNICPLNEVMDKNINRLGLLKNIKISEIKGILSAKLIRAQELGIDTVIDITEPISELKVDIIDIVRSLGIILDNAIEASLESHEKVINIGFIRKNNSVIIVVSNTFKDTGIPISEMFKLGVSTKGKNRGLGLSTLKEYMGKYRNITLDTFIEKNIFVQEITIKGK